MRAEDEGRTEEPSGGLRKRARKYGLVARSPDLSQAAGILAGLLVLRLGARSMAEEARLMVASFWGRAASIALSGGEAAMNAAFKEASGAGFRHFIALASIPLAAIAAAAMAAGLFQTGFRLFPGITKPDFRRLRGPAARGQGEKERIPGRLYEGFRAAIRSILLIFVAGIVIIPGLRDRALVPGSPPLSVFVRIVTLLFRLSFGCAALLTATALVDWLYRRRILFDSLKLTPTELKEEKRDEEGDPAYRAQLRNRGKELASAWAIVRKDGGER